MMYMQTKSTRGHSSGRKHDSRKTVATRWTPSNARNSSKQPAQSQKSTKSKKKKGSAVKESMFKTELCRNRDNGLCPFGSECAFAHSMEELRTPPPAKPEAAMTSPQLDQNEFVCESWLTTGHCAMMDQCPLFHDVRKAGTSPTPSDDLLSLLSGDLEELQLTLTPPLSPCSDPQYLVESTDCKLTPLTLDSPRSAAPEPEPSPCSSAASSVCGDMSPFSLPTIVNTNDLPILMLSDPIWGPPCEKSPDVDESVAERLCLPPGLF